MPSFLSLVLTLGTLGSLAAADDIYTYLQEGCTGASFHFKDIDHNICAVSITHKNVTLQEAIANNWTAVQSSKFEVQETGKKHFVGWDQGPDSNADGLLQCGHITVDKQISKRETCITAPEPTSFHGISWYEGNTTLPKRSQRTCTGTKNPDSLIFADGRVYGVKNIPQKDFDDLVELAFGGATGDALPAELAKYEQL
ncbi:hypothetical protein ACN47E_001586 [Coniothyrium glycines]